MRRLADGLLWVGAVLGAVSLVAAVLVGALGLVPLIFTSGSMAPEVSTGSLGVARSVPVAELHVDDVVSVESSEGVRVTHRIMAIAKTPDGTLLTLKGDANSEPDADPYQVTEADRLLFSVPRVGYVLSALASPFVLFAAGIAAAGVVFAVLSGSHRSGGGRPPGGARRAAKGGRRGRTASGHGGEARRTDRTSAGLLVAALPVLLALQPAEPTTAAFSDLGGTVTTSGFVAHRVGQPSDVTCTNSGASMTVGTTVTDPRYTYWAQAFTTAGASISSSKQMSGTTSTRSASFALADFSPSIVAGTTYHVRVSARVAGTTWQSAEFRTQPFSRVADAVACGSPVIAPTIGFTFPKDGGYYYKGDMSSSLASGCGSSSTIAACGTASDDGTIASVHYTLERHASHLGTRCWDGNAWVTSCAYRSATTNSSTAPLRWSVPRLGSAWPYDYEARYTLTIRAIDNEGHATVRTIVYRVW